MASEPGSVPSAAPEIVERLLPAPAAAIALAGMYLDLDFPRGVPVGGTRRPFVAINMVTTFDGKTQLQGTAKGIGSPIDKRLMRHLRAGVDVVLNGAGTLRADEVLIRLPPELVELRRRRGESDKPRYAVLSRLGDLPLERKIFAHQPPPIVILGADAPAANIANLKGRAEVIVAPEPSPSPGSILRALEEHLGATRVLLEGGPTINQLFFAAGAVDELFLTFAPKILGGPPGLPIVVGNSRLPSIVEAQLLSLYRAGSELFLRYSFGDKS